MTTIKSQTIRGNDLYNKVRIALGSALPKVESATVGFREQTLVMRRGNRQLMFDVEGIQYGPTDTIHAYGQFSPKEIKDAADFLAHPDCPPKAIVEDVETIVEGLLSAGVRKGHISVDYNSADKPVIRNMTNPEKSIRFGVFGPRTINGFRGENCGSLVYTQGAIDYLLE